MGKKHLLLLLILTALVILSSIYIAAGTQAYSPYQQISLFPAWFHAGCYSGFVCGILAIAGNVLYTTLRRLGTTKQLIGVLTICTVSTLLLLLTLIWYNARFNHISTPLPTVEITSSLTAAAFFGWLLPLGITAAYCLYTLPRDPTTSGRIPRPQVQAALNNVISLQAPRYQPGVVPPFVYSEDTPWGWLEYRSGNFQGQRLALKRQIATIGRDENSDIWVDDEMVSRHHAELAWDQDKVYLTDCGSLNGISLNGQRVHGTALVSPNALIGVGSHRFTFIPADHQESLTDLSDPLAHHKWRSSFEEDSENLPVTSLQLHEVGGSQNMPLGRSGETSKEHEVAPLPLPGNYGGLLIIQGGEMAGQRFQLGQQVVTVGRGDESDIVLHDPSISRRHVQFSHQGDGDYVHDLGSRSGTRINDER